MMVDADKNYLFVTNFVNKGIVCVISVRRNLIGGRDFYYKFTMKFFKIVTFLLSSLTLWTKIT